MTLSELLSRLEGVKKSGAGYVARCPAHEDQKASLSLKEENGKLLLKCHAGCHTEAVLAALGSDWKALFPQEERLPPPRVRSWPIRDTTGRLIATHYRQEPGKDIWWERDGRPGLAGLSLKDLPLYLSEDVSRFDAARPVLLCEGEKATDAVVALAVQALGTVTGASSCPGPSALEALRGREVYLWPDHDAPGQKHMQRVAAALRGIASKATVLALPAWMPEKGDAVEWCALLKKRGFSTEQLRALLEAGRLDPEAPTERGAGEAAPRAAGARHLTLTELLALELPPREFLLTPWLRAQDLVELYGWRGAGKSFLAQHLAYAVVSGGELLRWQAPSPRGVLYVDGELPLVTLKERFKEIVRGSQKEAKAELRLLSAEYAEGLPDLSTPEGQALVEASLDGMSLVILDNLSTLFRAGVENEAESWTVAQEWLLSLRRRGLAVLFVHHSGKGGNQRGTSKREDILDTVLALKRPEDYSPEDGARFELHFEKARGLHGTAVCPFEARLGTGRYGHLEWTLRDLEELKRARILSLAREGLSQVAIAKELGLNQSNVSRAIKKARSEGTF